MRTDNQQKARINILKDRLGLQEELYRTYLKMMTGKDSLREMTHEERDVIIRDLQNK